MAINNATEARTLDLPWPGGTAPLRDALTGAVARPAKERHTLTVPPLFGTVLLGRP